MKQPQTSVTAIGLAMAIDLILIAVSGLFPMAHTFLPLSGTEKGQTISLIALFVGVAEFYVRIPSTLWTALGKIRPDTKTVIGPGSSATLPSAPASRGEYVAEEQNADRPDHPD